MLKSLANRPRFGHGFKHIPILVGPEGDEIIARNRRSNAVFDGVFVNFRGEGAEHSIPDHEHACIVTINIAPVFTVVHAVVARRIKDIFDGWVQFVNHGGVNKELVNQRQGICHTNPDGVKSHHCQRHIK